MERKIFVQTKHNAYLGAEGQTIIREEDTKSEHFGKWVLRDKANTVIDTDAFVHDLAERNCIAVGRLYGDVSPRKEGAGNG